jgi:hypothetical protein
MPKVFVFVEESRFSIGGRAVHHYRRRVPFKIDWAKARKADRLPATVKAVQMGEPFLVVDSRGEKRGEAGDWIVMNEWGCLYLTTDLVFKQAFRLITGEAA